MLDRTYDFDETAFAQIIDVAQGGVPALLLDLPHEWTAWVRGTLLSADEVVLTVEPDLGNLRNAKNIVDLLRQARKNDVPPRLVINKVGMAKRPEISVEDFAEALKLTPDAVIPCDPQLFGTAANNGQMIAETDAKSPVVEAFDAIARVITGRSELKRARRGGLSPFLSRLRGKSA